MNNQEPEVFSSILVRPAYRASGEIYKTSIVKWIGELYVRGKKIYETSDVDSRSAAFNSVAQHIKWYQNKYNSSIFIDSAMNKKETE
jgi:hypothetical protein